MTTDTHPIETVSAGCQRYLGGIGFPHSSGADLRVLDSLRWIDDGLGMNANGELRSLVGAERLEHVGLLIIINEPHIDSLAPLARLRSVEGMVKIVANAALTSLRGLERLEEAGSLDLSFVEDSPDLDLDALRCLRRVEGDVFLRRVSREQVDAFLARVEVGGSVTLDGEVIVEGPAAGP